jgi:hypothetical protein
LGKDVSSGRLFDADAENRAVEAMETAVGGRVAPDALRNENDPWWTDVQASDEFGELVFPRFFRAPGRRTGLAMAGYHRLAPHVPRNKIAPEVIAVLEAIRETAAAAWPARPMDSDGVAQGLE